MANTTDIKISVIGLGKLGAPLAAVMAECGYTVTGMDINTDYVDAVNAGKSPVQEPQLQDFITAGKGRLTATTNTAEAILNSDISFIIVPTPSQDDHTFSNDYLIKTLSDIGQALQQKDGYHLVAITSTVMPGATGGVLKDTLEAASGRIVGDHLGLCYSPEFIALGSVIRDMQYPDFVLIGESDQKAGDMLQRVYERVCINEPPFRRMNYVNAELSKIAINTFVTTKISYANMLAEICENLEHADVDIVSNTLGSDTRIGKKYLKGGVAYGGPCFPRDNRAFTAMAKQLGTASHIAEATDHVNAHQTTRLVKAVQKYSAKKTNICILGLSYKPDTDVIEKSPSIELALALKTAGFSVSAHDPLVGPSTAAEVGQALHIHKSIEAAVAEGDTFILMTPWPEYLTALKSLAQGRKEKITIIDPWRFLTEIHDITIIQLGKA